MRANSSAQANRRSARGQTRISGTLRCGRRTKLLARRLSRGDIAVIDHADIDSVSAEMLVERQIAGVVNLSPSISGKYPNRGPSILAANGIHLVDILRPELMDQLKDGASAQLAGAELYVNGQPVASGEVLAPVLIRQRLDESSKNLNTVLEEFARNTLLHASQELSDLLSPVDPPQVRTVMQDRHVLVVVRGEDYKKDLNIIRGYLDEVRPVLIGVDGGADALVSLGYRPDIIIGDMDSVSDSALRSGAEVIVHTYSDGRTSPGLDRIQKLGVQHKTFAVAGTSEDAAMLLAFEKGAELIVAVGTHSNLFDFLDKGRGGMASTLLVRMRIGSRLVDARGVSKLYGRSRKTSLLIIMLVVAALLLVVVLLQQSPALRNWLEMAGNWMRLFFLQRALGK